MLRLAGGRAPCLIEAPLPGAEKTFTAIFPTEEDALCPAILPTADLNGDGRVNFADFALFSAVYGTEYHVEPGECPSAERPSDEEPSPPSGDFGGEAPDFF